MDLNEFIGRQLWIRHQELFFRAYVAAVYFTDTGDVDQPGGEAELTESFLRRSGWECRRFVNAYAEQIGEHIEQAGHDFWLTRNGHGAGFWDRPELYGEDESAELTRACEFAGESDAEFED